MENYLKTIGQKIREIRKIRGMTLEELAKKIHKSKSALSKYENGEINIDILTLKEISEVFEIDIINLIPRKELKKNKDNEIESIPSFFKNNSKIYTYYYDGRNSKIVISQIELDKYNNEIIMYMNFLDYSHPYICENTYSGSISHYDSITRINLENKDTNIEKPIITILSPFVDTEERWGLWTGISIRPIMPASVKMLFSSKIIEDDKELKKRLILSKEDIYYIKKFNMFSVF